MWRRVAEARIASAASRGEVRASGADASNRVEVRASGEKGRGVYATAAIANEENKYTNIEPSKPLMNTSGMQISTVENA